MRRDTYRDFITDRELRECGSDLEMRLRATGRRDDLIRSSGARNVRSWSCSTVYDPRIFAYVIEISFASSSWTGRPPRLDRAYWKFGPIEYARAGVVAKLQLGPLSIIKVASLWVFALAGGFGLNGFTIGGSGFAKGGYVRGGSYRPGEIPCEIGRSR